MVAGFDIFECLCVKVTQSKLYCHAVNTFLFFEMLTDRVKIQSAKVRII